MRLTGVNEISRPVREELEKLEEELERIFSSKIDLVADISRHLLAAKGKRIRPTLLLLSSKLGKPDTEQAVKVALAVELIHTATLLHDDSIDRNHMRRGLPTVNRIWDDQVSVIMGDYLFCSAFQILHQAGLFEIASVLSAGSRLVTTGEMYQMDLRGRYDITEEQYLEMVRHKTAALFASACEAGAIVGNLEGFLRRQLRDYGENLGIAFQIVDDVLDFIGDVDVMGKPVGNDLKDRRVTLPLLFALGRATSLEASQIRQLIVDGSIDASAWKTVLEFIKRHGGIEYALSSARGFAERAKACLAGIDESPPKRALLAITEQVVARQQ